ncbi:prohibitin family protein [Candidatus Woesearchaeota archaeon]|nr:prohibitin family protein [Candidatus Woesearchaeota archaeon]
MIMLDSKPKKLQEVKMPEIKLPENFGAKASRFFKWAAAIIIAIILLPSVLVIIEPGYVGVDYTAWGGITLDAVRTPGWSFKLPFLQKVIKIKTARDTINMYGSAAECNSDSQCTDVALQVPSKEGLLITLDVTVLYTVQPLQAPRIVQEMTEYYIYGTLVPELRSVARETTGTMTITELYGTGREMLQQGIYDKLRVLFAKDGFVLEQVLVRDVEYPQQIRQAIEEKQTAEQVSFKKQFEIDIAEKEAKRKQIEGEGIANQKIAVAKGDAEALRLVSQAIKENPDVLKFKNLEALQVLYGNPNTRFIALPSNQMILPTDFNIGK